MQRSGIHKLQSLYAVLNVRGVTPVGQPALWNISIPPRVDVFLWLLTNNRLFLTRENLGKRKEVTDKTCVFCAEKESVSHLFLECEVI